MRRLLVALFVVAMAASVFALNKDSTYRDARRSGALAKIQIHVVDDMGQDVPNAEVSVFMGMNFRSQGYYFQLDGIKFSGDSKRGAALLFLLIYNPLPNDQP